jgi:hypothetical protein
VVLLKQLQPVLGAKGVASWSSALPKAKGPQVFFLGISQKSAPGFKIPFTVELDGGRF